MSFKILILGKDNAVGERFSRILSDQPFRIVFVDYLLKDKPLIDFPSSDDWKALIEKEQACVVVNLCLSISIAGAEKNFAIMSNLGTACALHNIPLIQLSSYRVFGTDYYGQGRGELDIPVPSDELGRRLLECEKAGSVAVKNIILRVSWVLNAFEQESLLAAAVDKLIQSDPLVVSDHKYGRPISASYIANSIFAVIQQVLVGADNWGIFHLRSSDSCSEAEFCDYLLRLLSSEMDIDISMPEVASINDSRSLLLGAANLRGQRLTDNYGIQFPSWRSGFKALLREWLALEGKSKK